MIGAKSDYSRVGPWLAMVKQAVNVGLTNAAKEHCNLVRKSWSKTPRGVSSSPGYPPSIQRRTLDRAMTSTPGVNGRASSGVSKGVPYARRLELGSGIAGPIRAKGGGSLAVPVNDQARRISEKGISLRTLDLVMIKPRGRAPFLVGKKKARVVTTPGKGVKVSRNVEPVWVLKKSVFIKARPFLRPQAKAPSIRVAFHTAADRYIKANVRNALGGAR